MKVVDVYKQYFKAFCLFNDIQRNAVSVTLTATSDQGMIQYEVTLSFFPHNTPDDFSISYDAYISKEIYHDKGRRSKKREVQFLSEIKIHANELAQSISAHINWEDPLIEARYE